MECMRIALTIIIYLYLLDTTIAAMRYIRGQVIMLGNLPLNVPRMILINIYLNIFISVVYIYACGFAMNTANIILRTYSST